MKGRTTCLCKFVFVFPQIPYLLGFWLTVSGVEQHIQIDKSSPKSKDDAKCMQQEYSIKSFTAKDEVKCMQLTMFQA
uniref:Uncharacterized protein n=1 Tax=Salix viminalis TaxID=40686 RepID=A0A6N2KWU8_SALVM